MLARFNGLLRSSKPLLVLTCLAAVLGITGSAYGARLITGLDVRDGSLTAADLSKTTRAALHGGKGDKGAKGLKGAAGTHGLVGSLGLTGAQGPIGLTGLQGATGGIGAASTVVGPRGLTGDTGPVSTVPGPQGPNATTEGAACTVPGPLTGHYHWTDLTGGAWSLTCIVP